VRFLVDDLFALVDDFLLAAFLVARFLLDDFVAINLLRSGFNRVADQTAGASQPLIRWLSQVKSL
jgi:hypothetical protein